MKPSSYLRITLAMAWKDLQVIFLDRGLLVVIIGLPLVFAILNSLINQRVSTNEGSQLFPVALVNLDQNAYGDQIVKTLNTLEVLKVIPVETIDKAKLLVLDSEVLAAVILPAGLTEGIDTYKPSAIEVIIDPTQEQFARIITGLMEEVVSPVVIQGEISYAIRTLLSEYPGYTQADEETRQVYEAQSVAVQMAQVMKMLTQPWISVEAKSQTGEDTVKIPANMFVLMVPSFTVMFAFFVVGDISKELLKEKREGSMRRLMASPIHPWMIILAKMLAYISLVLIQVVVIFGVASLAFDMPMGNSLPGLILVSVAMAFAATGIGILVMSIAKTEKQADTTGLLMGFALAALGGCFTFGSPVPLYKGGGILETISKLTPQAHALMGYDILLNEGGSLDQVLVHALILLGFAALGLAVASVRFKFE